MRTSMQREDSYSLENSSPALESRVSHLFTPMLMTPSLLTPQMSTPPELALTRGRHKSKPLPPMKEMRRRWSNSNERYLPQVDIADIPKYEHEGGLIKGNESEDDTPY